MSGSRITPGSPVHPTHLDAHADKLVAALERNSDASDRLNQKLFWVGIAAVVLAVLQLVAAIVVWLVPL